MEVEAIDAMTLADLAKKLDGLEGGVALLRIIEGLHERISALEKTQATLPAQVAEIVAERVLAVLERERFAPQQARLNELIALHTALGNLVTKHSDAIVEQRAAIQQLQRAGGPQRFN